MGLYCIYKIQNNYPAEQKQRFIQKKSTQPSATPSRGPFITAGRCLRGEVGFGVGGRRPGETPLYAAPPAEDMGLISRRFSLGTERFNFVVPQKDFDIFNGIYYIYYDSQTIAQKGAFLCQRQTL
jgi:hypothetical protein